VDNSSNNRPWSEASGGMGSPPSDLNSAASAPVLQQAQQKAGQVADQARQQVVSQLADQKERAASGLGSVAQALRDTGQQLRTREQEPLAQYAEGAADMVERFSGYLNQRDIHQLMYEVETAARRQPAVFIGGAFLLGFAAARFLKSSSPSGMPASDFSGLQGGTARESWSSYPTGMSATPAYQPSSASPTYQPTAASPAYSAAVDAGGSAAVTGGTRIPVQTELDEDEDLTPATGSTAAGRLGDVE
jgi:hypothetical protein